MPARPRRARESPNGQPVGYTVKDLPADERPRERLLERGPGSLSDAELLAVILRTGLVGEMVTEMATDVLQQFGGFWGLAGMPISELTKRRGLKGAKVAQLKAAIEIGKRMAERRPSEERAQITTPDDAHRLLQFHMTHLDQEEMWIILLDTKNRVIGQPRCVFRGSLNSTHVRTADLFRDAVRESAAAIVVAHNHPSGETTPSAEDVRVTAEIRAAGQLLDIELLDHLVIGRGERPFVSLKQRGLGFR